MLALLAGGGPDEALKLLTADSAVAGLLAGRRDDELAAEAGRAAEDSEDADGLRFAAFSRAVSAPALAVRPPVVAAAAVLRLLRIFAGAASASLWTVGDDDEPTCVATAGSRGVTACAVGETAYRTGTPAFSSSGVAVPQHRHGRLVGALAAETTPSDRMVAYLDVAAAALEPILERDFLLERAAGRESAISSSLERRLSRVAYDLHDGPLQELAAFGLDLDLARRQIGSVVPADDAARVSGRFGDLAGRLVSLDASLREVVQSLKGTSRESEPVRDRLEREIALLRDHGFTAWIEIDGDLTLLSDSQQIALLRVVQEALGNVCDHSGARSVHVRIVEREGGVEGAVVDDGCGFDVAAAEADATRRRRFGLAGMRERIRLLDGELRISSTPGVGTRVEFVLRPWHPLREPAAAGSEVPA